MSQQNRRQSRQTIEAARAAVEASSSCGGKPEVRAIYSTKQLPSVTQNILFNGQIIDVMP